MRDLSTNRARRPTQSAIPLRTPTAAVVRRRTPRRTIALIVANALSAAVQGQFQFVMPWILLAEGFSPTWAVFATAVIYAPLLLTAVPAGASSDTIDLMLLMRVVTWLSLAACALYPLGAAFGYDGLALLLVGAGLIGTLRNFSEAAVFRGMADTTTGQGLLRAHTIRTTINQVAIFGSPFAGLLLFHTGGTLAVMLGMCVLLVVALGVLAVVPEIVSERAEDVGLRASMRDGLGSLRANPRLQAIALANMTWNVFAGAALGSMPAILREHLEFGETRASATILVGILAVVGLTLPLAGMLHRRLGPAQTFVVAATVQGLAVLLFVNPALAVVAPVAYALFLLANSGAAASINGARAVEVDQRHQGLLNMTVLTIGMVGFIAGVLGAAAVLGVLGFGAMIAVIGAGMALTALGFRRPLSAG